MTGEKSFLSRYSVIIAAIIAAIGAIIAALISAAPLYTQKPTVINNITTVNGITDIPEVSPPKNNKPIDKKQTPLITGPIKKPLIDEPKKRQLITPPTKKSQSKPKIPLTQSKHNNKNIKAPPIEKQQQTKTTKAPLPKSTPLITAALKNVSSKDTTLTTIKNRNLIKNGDLSVDYTPDWQSFFKHPERSTLKHKDDSLVLSFTGKGNDELEASVFQLIDIDHVKGLNFSTTLKVWDRNEVGFAVAKLTFFDDVSHELFQFVLTSDDYYESHRPHKIIPIAFNREKTVNINIQKQLASSLSAHIIKRIKLIKVSYEISVPLETLCKRCSIAFSNNQLFYQ